MPENFFYLPGSVRFRSFSLLLLTWLTCLCCLELPWVAWCCMICLWRNFSEALCCLMFCVVWDSLGCLGMKVYGFTDLDCWLVCWMLECYVDDEMLRCLICVFAQWWQCSEGLELPNFLVALCAWIWCLDFAFSRFDRLMVFEYAYAFCFSRFWGSKAFVAWFLFVYQLLQSLCSCQLVLCLNVLVQVLGGYASG